jgi:hypothetical protein
MLFSDVSDVPSVARTSKLFKSTLDGVEDKLWKQLVVKHLSWAVRLLPLITVKNEADGTFTTGTLTMKEAFKRKVQLDALSWRPFGLNRDLQRDLHFVFIHKGIVGFSNYMNQYFENEDTVNGDTEGTEDTEPAFVPRAQGGIFFTHIHLNGFNYDPDKYCRGGLSTQVPSVEASYIDFSYLIDNWESECDLLYRWSAVLGLQRDEVNIVKPESRKHCVLILLKKNLKLEGWPEGCPEDRSERIRFIHGI